MAESPANVPNFAESLPDQAEKLPPGWLSRWPWATFLLPMAVYMLVGSMEPMPPPSTNSAADPTVAIPLEAPVEQLLDEPGEDVWEESRGTGPLPKIPYRNFPWVYSAKIALTLLTMVLVWPGYRTFPWKVSGWSVVVGVVGVVLWVVLCDLRLEPKLIGPIDRFLGGLIPGLEEGQTPSVGLMSILGTGERSAFNPLVQLKDNSAWAYGFLAIRFFGLALVVPVIEEFFLRGLLMRYVIHQQWWQVPFGTVNRTAVVIGTAVPILMHPSELLAALVWFSMVTWLMIHTRSIWDCVVAHAITNLLLGIYVVWWDQWQLM